MRPLVMKLPLLLFTFIALVALVAAGPRHVKNDFNLNSRDPHPDCSNCTAYLNKCLDTCGPMNPHCQRYCLTQTCTIGPEHCHSGQVCALPTEECGDKSKHLVARGCKQCGEWIESCYHDCGGIYSPQCRAQCHKMLCAWGPDQCSSDTCGNTYGCDPSTHTKASSNDVKARDENSVDPCVPCTSFFTNCINTCPVKIAMGCANVCKFKTCNIVGHLCPADCDLGLGATLDDCPKT